MTIIQKIKIWWKIKQAVRGIKMLEGKNKWKSKTLWFNAIGSIVGVAASLHDSGIMKDPQIQSSFVLFITVGNGILRFLTTKPIEK